MAHHGIMHWFIFLLVIGGLLAFDLGVLHKKDEKMDFRSSLYLSIFYISIACLFSFYIYFLFDAEKTKQYFTGFLIEKAMSLDNIFVISIIFKFFAIPLIYQHRVLFWGILGVVILRAIMILLGGSLIAKFAWILYVFAAVLIFTGIKMFYVVDKQFNIQELYFYKFLQRHLRITNEINDHSFFVRIDNKIYATPLFIALGIVEAMDLVFAIDSIPAIFAITTDSYIVYTSNIFAILGLRALFFCLSDIVERFKYLKYSLAFILIFIGIKIFVSHFVKVPTYISLSVTIGLLLIGIIVSIVKTSRGGKSFQPDRY